MKELNFGDTNNLSSDISDSVERYIQAFTVRLLQLP